MTQSVNNTILSKQKKRGCATFVTPLRFFFIIKPTFTLIKGLANQEQKKDNHFTPMN